MNLKISPFAKVEFESATPGSHWFGYYNYSPISQDGNKLLSQCVGFDGRSIQRSDTADVGWFDLADGVWHKIGTTRAINWQQGAMLQWLGPDYNSRVVYNDVDGDHFCAKIVDVNTGGAKTLPWPVYGVSPDGRFAITLQFERCAWTRAYHYESIRNEKWNVDVPEEDGIFRLDLETGEVKRIISIRDIVAMLPEEDVNPGDAHWVEHIMLNPSGTRFAFYHRYGRGDDFVTKAYTADVDGKNIFSLAEMKRCTFSHLGWKDDENFVIYTYAKTKIFKDYVKTRKSKTISLKTILVSCARRIARLILPKRCRHSMLGKDYYTFVSDQNGVVEKLDRQAITLYGDGHPSFTKNGKWMLTDTYEQPDSTRILLLYHLPTKRTIELGRFYSPFNSCDYRSDLHPRFSRDESRIVIDSAHSGRHQIVVLAIDWKDLDKEVSA